MQVTVKLFATFRVGRFAAESRNYPPGTRVAQILAGLQIPEGEVGMLMRNGRHVEPDQALDNGDVLAIFPLVGGG